MDALLLNGIHAGHKAIQAEFLEYWGARCCKGEKEGFSNYVHTQKTSKQAYKYYLGGSYNLKSPINNVSKSVKNGNFFPLAVDNNMYF